MNTAKNYIISDELLAAYLDGNLSDEQTQFVEEAIESDPKLQWIVDRWIETQTNEYAPMNVEQAENNHKEHNVRRYWTVAASVLILVALSLPLLLKMNNINPDSGLPMDFPVSQRVHSEYNPIKPPDVINDEDADNDASFSYQYEHYKNSVIITWDEPVEGAYCFVSAKNNNHYFSLECKNTEIRRVFVIPLGPFEPSDYPLTIALKFVHSGQPISDTIIFSK